MKGDEPYGQVKLRYNNSISIINVSNNYVKLITSTDYENGENNSANNYLNSAITVTAKEHTLNERLPYTRPGV